MNYQERLQMLELRDRTAKLARTYLRKVSNLLHSDAKFPMSSWNRDVMDEALDVAKEIIERLPDDYFESTVTPDYFGLLAGMGIANEKHNSSDETLERAQAVVAAIEKRRGDVKLRKRIEALENVEGRTPEEADSYRAKAAELRAG